jgi:manganese transport protein
LLRRTVTLIPALVVLAIGIDPTQALVISQVVLSFGIPFALIPLLRLTSRRSVMGDAVNHTATIAIGCVVVTAVVALNLVLLYLTIGDPG